MRHSSLGKVYESGEAIVRQGDAGDCCMYVIQEGRVEVVREDGNAEVQLGILDEGDFFGEMSLFERESRAATVRALGPVRVLTVDRKTFMRRVHEDPSLAFNLLVTMCQRIRRLNLELHETRAQLEQARPTPYAEDGV
jgi:CRP-like cAMP-binding protein